MAEFVYRILPPRADFVATITADERAIMGRHFAYLTELHAKSPLRFVGRTLGGDYGLVVYDAADLDEATAIAKADPSVAEGLMQVEVLPFMVVEFD